jgi:hypothetical protein
MNATELAIYIAIWRWEHPHNVISLDDYRAQRWMRRYTRPMGGDAA